MNLEEDEEYSTCDELNVLDDSDYYSCDEVEVPSTLPAPTIEAQAKSRVTPRSAKRSPGSDRLAAQAQLIADYRQTKDQHCQEAMEEDGELVCVHWNPYTPVESGDSTTPCVEQPTFGWSRDKKKEGDFLGYGRKTQPSEVVDHNDTVFEIWQKDLRWCAQTLWCMSGSKPRTIEPSNGLKTVGAIERRKGHTQIILWRRETILGGVSYMVFNGSISLIG